MIPLKDLTFLIALKIDSQDRLNNLDITVNYIQHHFDTNIVICEQDKSPQLIGRYDCGYIFYKTDEFFNRQRGVNLAAKLAKTPVLVHYDADILLSPNQIQRSVEVIIEKKADIIYPYDGRFYDVPKYMHEHIVSAKSVNVVDTSKCILFNSHSVGGAVFFDTKAYWTGGGANENFRGLGYEDNEINSRFTKLGFNVGRMTGPLFHLNHIRLDSSFNHNPFLNDNIAEFTRIDRMSKSQLLLEINTWKWKNDNI